MISHYIYTIHGISLPLYVIWKIIYGISLALYKYCGNTIYLSALGDFHPRPRARPCNL